MATSRATGSLKNARGTRMKMGMGIAMGTQHADRRMGLGMAMAMALRDDWKSVETREFNRRRPQSRPQSARPSLRDRTLMAYSSALTRSSNAERLRFSDEELNKLLHDSHEDHGQEKARDHDHEGDTIISGDSLSTDQAAVETLPHHGDSEHRLNEVRSIEDNENEPGTPASYCFDAASNLAEADLGSWRNERDINARMLECFISSCREERFALSVMSSSEFWKRKLHELLSSLHSVAQPNAFIVSACAYMAREYMKELPQDSLSTEMIRMFWEELCRGIFADDEQCLPYFVIAKYEKERVKMCSAQMKKRCSQLIDVGLAINSWRAHDASSTKLAIIAFNAWRKVARSETRRRNGAAFALARTNRARTVLKFWYEWRRKFTQVSLERELQDVRDIHDGTQHELETINEKQRYRRDPENSGA